MKKEKGIHARFAVIPHTEEIVSTVHGKCKAKKEKALNLYNKIF